MLTTAGILKIQLCAMLMQNAPGDAAAVPASCNAIADAKLLPPDVFNCPKVQAKEEEKPVKDDDPDADYCWDFKNEDKCNNDEKCAWCTAGAVPPSCNSLKGASELPPSVFKCAKVPQKEEKPVEEVKPVKKLSDDADYCWDIKNSIV